LKDRPEQLLEEIKHFFEVYKALEPEKHSATAGFEGRKAAWREIESSRANFQATAHH
jgi:inorganic pyrophosphatase